MLHLVMSFVTSWFDSRHRILCGAQETVGNTSDPLLSQDAIKTGGCGPRIGQNRPASDLTGRKEL